MGAEAPADLASGAPRPPRVEPGQGGAAALRHESGPVCAASSSYIRIGPAEHHRQPPLQLVAHVPERAQPRRVIAAGARRVGQPPVQPRRRAQEHRALLLAAQRDHRVDRRRVDLRHVLRALPAAVDPDLASTARAWPHAPGSVANRPTSRPRAPAPVPARSPRPAGCARSWRRTGTGSRAGPGRDRRLPPGARPARCRRPRRLPGRDRRLAPAPRPPGPTRRAPPSPRGPADGPLRRPR